MRKGEMNRQVYLRPIRVIMGKWASESTQETNAGNYSLLALNLVVRAHGGGGEMILSQR